MKILILSITCILYVSTAIAQSERFIEVAVSETVELNASEFIFAIKNESSFSEFETMMREMEEMEEIYDELEGLEELREIEEIEEPPVMTLGQLKAILSKKNIKYTVLFSEEGSSDNLETWELRATLASPEELWNLEKLISEENGVLGRIHEVKYEPTDKYCTDVYPRLLDRAKKRADLLASGAGKKVGQVLQISEGKEVLNGIQEWSEYTARLIESLIERGKKGIQLTRTTIISLTYRFELL